MRLRCSVVGLAAVAAMTAASPAEARWGKLHEFPGPIDLATNPEGDAVVWWSDPTEERVLFQLASRRGALSERHVAFPRLRRGLEVTAGTLAGNGTVTIFPRQPIDEDPRQGLYDYYRVRATAPEYDASVRLAPPWKTMHGHVEEARTASGARLLGWSSQDGGIGVAETSGRRDFGSSYQRLGWTAGTVGVTISGSTRWAFWLDGGGFRPIRLARRSSGGDWRARTLHRRNGEFAAIEPDGPDAASGGGHIVVTWLACRMESPVEECRIEYRVRRDGRWSEPKILPGSSASTLDGPQIAMAPDGSVLIVFVASDGRLMVARGRFGDIAAPSALPGGVHARDLHLAANTRGRLLLAYSTIEGDGSQRPFAVAGHVRRGLGHIKNIAPASPPWHTPSASVDEQGDGWVAGGTGLLRYRR